MKSAGYVPPHSCQDCEQFLPRLYVDGNFYRLPQELREETAKAIWGPEADSDALTARQKEAIHRHHFFQTSHGALRQYATSGCLLADYLAKDLSHENEKRVVTLSIHWSDYRKERPYETVLFGYIRSTTRKDSFQIHLQGLRLCMFDILKIRGDPAEKYFGAYALNQEPGSESAIRTYRDWMLACQDNHVSCRMAANFQMPTRVLEVLEEEQGGLGVRLVETNHGQVEKYAALTYCWGGDQALKTTRGNLQDHKLQIEGGRLPYTLRDAAIVTKRLGLKYLWIDALCIVQDDDIDKGTEIGRMSDIYYNAAVVISASRASHANEGFLHSRTPFGTKYGSTFKLACECPDGQDGAVVLNSSFSPPEEPIFKRAWTFQERVLAPRFLEFGEVQTRWFCRNSSLDLLTVDGWKTSVWHQALHYGHDDQILRTSKLILGEFPDRPGRGVDNAEEYLDLWQSIIKMHSQRLLGFEQDRLLSLAGIAERFSKFIGDEYVCGMWRCDIQNELLWTRKLHTDILPKPTQYIAPSWSWASINHVVSTSRRGNLDSNFKVIDCGWELAIAQSPFGAVRSGYLKVQGCLLPVKCRWKTSRPSSAESDPLFRLKRLYIEGYVLSGRGLNVNVDCRTRKEGPAEVSLLLVSDMSSSSRDDDRNVAGLILSQDENGLYSRLGNFDSHELKAHEGGLYKLLSMAGPREVTII